MHKAKKKYSEFIAIDKSLRIGKDTKKAHQSELLSYRKAIVSTLLSKKFAMVYH